MAASNGKVHLAVSHSYIAFMLLSCGPQEKGRLKDVDLVCNGLLSTEVGRGRGGQGGAPAEGRTRAELWSLALPCFLGLTEQKLSSR